jgi:glycosyltransferase involved in cell wall biosynthesis
MHVAYLSLLSPPGQPAASGVPKVSETLLGEFERMEGLEVDAVTLVDGLERAVVEQRGNVRYHYLPCRASGKTATFYLFETLRLRRQLRALGPDIVHGQPTGEYLLAATGAACPHVITVHGLVQRESQGLSRWHPGQLAGRIREHLQRRAVRRARHMISISPYVEDYVRGWTSARIWPIPNPIDPEFFQIPAPESMAEAGATVAAGVGRVSGAGLRLLCVGVVSARKNQALLVEACHALARRSIPFECRLVGIIQPEFGDRIRARIEELGLSGRVVLTGVVSREELRAHYAWSTVVVLPSREETSPLSLIQGLAAGRCVLGADAAGIPRLLNNGQYGGLFPGQDAEALADALEQVYRHPETVEARTHAGQAFAHAQFQPRAVAERTVGAYSAVLEGRG